MYRALPGMECVKQRSSDVPRACDKVSVCRKLEVGKTRHPQPLFGVLEWHVSSTKPMP